MNLLHIIASVDPADGGPIEGVRQQARTYREAGLEIHVACLDCPEAPFVKDFPGKVFALGGPERTGWQAKLPWAHYGYQARMVPWLRENIARYDAVIVNGLWNYSTLSARRALVNSGVPYAVFTHGMLDPWFKKTYPVKNLVKQLFWLFCEGPLLNHANAVFFTTKDEMVVSKDAFQPYRIKGKVVGFGASDAPGNPQDQIAAFRAALPRLGNRPYLLYLSRIHPKKGVDMLIEAFAAIALDHPELDLVIAGPDQVGWQQDLEELAQDLEIAGRIHWPGMLMGDRKWGAFRGCEAFVLSSHQENFGVVVAEALACAKAVLISDKVQIWHEVAEAGAGLVKPDTPEGTRELLQEFMALPPQDVEHIQQAARTLFEDKFEIHQAMTNIRAAIAEITSQSTHELSRA